MNPRRLQSATISSRVTSGALVSVASAIRGAEATGSPCRGWCRRGPASAAAEDLSGDLALALRSVEAGEAGRELGRGGRAEVLGRSNQAVPAAMEDERE